MDFETLDSILMEEREGFYIQDGAQAEWAAQKIKRRRQERDRLLSEIDTMIEYYNGKREEEIAKADADCSFLLSKLEEYMRSQEVRTKTKTTEYVRIPSGKLLLKYGTYEYERDDSALCDYFKRTAPEYVITTEKPNWGEFKRQTTVMPDGSVVHADTGEIVYGVRATKKPDTFDVALK